MRYPVFLILVLAGCLCAARPAAAQTAADRYQKQAYNYRARKQYDKAIVSMQQALKAAPADQNVYATLGAWLYERHRFAEAASVLQQGSRMVKNGGRVFARPLARSLIRSGNPAEALRVLGSNPPQKADPEWELLRRQATFAAGAGRRMGTDTAVNLGVRINTAYPELYPFLSTDSQRFYFTRRINGVDEDLMKSVPDSCGDWLSARSMGSPPNSLQQEAAQSISADGHYLFFMRCDNKSENGWEGGGCDLYMAYTADSVWSQPESFGATINTPGYEGMPCLSPDNKALFFVSDRSGGYGGLDIWTTRFEQGLWQQPRNLGPEVNTPGDETAPFLHADNRTLYFTSTGHPGFGGQDLYRCRRGTDTLWTGVENLGLPFNSPADEASVFVLPNGRMALFSSDRGGPAGNFDVYSVSLPKELQPAKVTYVKGFVHDSISGERLNYARLSVLEPGSQQSLYEYQSNRGDGSFMMILEPGRQYLLETNRAGYRERMDTLYFAEQYLAEPASLNVAMLSSDYKKPVVDSLVLTLHYQKNITVIDDSARSLLGSIMASYVADTEATVLVNSYTDNSGTPLLNDQISDLRARQIAQELEKLGFPYERIQAQGWAEASPVAPNDNEENRYRNRRVEIIIRK